jgi:hypothetical protein
MAALCTSFAFAGTSTELADQASEYFASQATPAAVVDPWLRNVLNLQNKVDYHEPLATATFLMTHNSYNASAYRSAFAYIDPNQKLSIGQQLDAGVRSLELDVHRFFSMSGWPWQWKNRLLLCHGQDNHLGCSPYDRKLEAGIDEIKTWLDKSENQQEVIVVYIEDHIDDRYSELVSIITQRLGSKIYRPNATGGCQGIPMHISKQTLLDAGKQVLLMGASEVCSSNSGWDSWAFAGVGDRLSGYPTGDIENVDGVQCDFARSFYDRFWVRFYEDRTLLSSLFADPDRIDDNAATWLQKCGANLIGFDKLVQTDTRLHASVWSWDTDQPSDTNGSENCALSQPNARFHDQACTEVARYACRKPGTHEWYVTQTAGIWNEGGDTCQRETNGAFVFAVPTNGYDNEQLRTLKQQNAVERVWLNLHDQNTEHQWQANLP